MRTGRETTAMVALRPPGAVTASDELPDDPQELKRLLLQERAQLREKEDENLRLIGEYWNYAMNGMVAKSLRAATFVADPSGAIRLWSDPAELCASAGD